MSVISYTHENGYGNADLDEVRRIIAEGVPDPRNRAILRELVCDYDTLRSVIDGKNAVFTHPDRSETRRIKLY